MRILGDTGDGGLSARLYMRDPVAPRFSTRSLPIFLAGCLDKQYDGVDGTGFFKPSEDGVFARVGPVRG